MKDDGEFYRLIYDLNVLARETRRKWREPRSSWRSSSRQRASRLDDLPHGNYALRLCGLQKVHLELDGEHVPIGGHDREPATTCPLCLHTTKQVQALQYLDDRPWRH